MCEFNVPKSYISSIIHLKIENVRKRWSSLGPLEGFVVKRVWRRSIKYAHIYYWIITRQMYGTSSRSDPIWNKTRNNHHSGDNKYFHPKRKLSTHYAEFRPINPNTWLSQLTRKSWSILLRFIDIHVRASSIHTRHVIGRLEWLQI